MRANKTATWIVIAAMAAGTPSVAAGQEVVAVGGESVATPTDPPVPDSVTTVETTVEAAAAVDTVTLRDGGVVRGTVSESFPGRHVVIVTVAGERYTFGWDRVLDVRYGAQAAVVPAANIPPPLTVGPGRPRVHIELTREATVRLYELTGTIMVPSGSPLTTSSTPAAAARPVCMEPCDAVIDGTGGQSFFIGGDRVMPSRRFTLRDLDGDINVVVKPGRPGVFIGGAMFTSLSLAPLVSGAVFMAVSRPQEGHSPQSLHRTGGVLLGVGAGLLVAGIIMLAVGRTRVEFYKQMTGVGQRRRGPASL